MRSPVVRLVIGLLLAAAGAVWTLQGLGYLQGSSMTGVTLWAVVGPLVLLAGIWLAVSSRRARRS
ncbi:hypothetical protein [Ornithinimicrobium avium]|uniref:Integral membrane protein n=1 Tax=Ornithinimicrobium avium TaxID=2283195 RepID=A0A345NL30_9MICO|nr:hypothetical protein [Ornithinimicrobium avium]AXH95738.1 hypothetical protein DV701_06005 [Ornithinimicrobium avium]